MSIDPCDCSGRGDLTGSIGGDDRAITIDRAGQGRLRRDDRLARAGALTTRGRAIKQYRHTHYEPALSTHRSSCLLL